MKQLKLFFAVLILVAFNQVAYSSNITENEKKKETTLKRTSSKKRLFFVPEETPSENNENDKNFQQGLNRQSPEKSSPKKATKKRKTEMRSSKFDSPEKRQKTTTDDTYFDTSSYNECSLQQTNPPEILDLPKPLPIQKESPQSEVQKFDKFTSYDGVLDEVQVILEDDKEKKTVLILDCHGTLTNIKDSYTSFPKALKGAKEFLEGLEGLKNTYPNFYFLASSAYRDQGNVIETLQKAGLSPFFDIPDDFAIETIDENGLTYKKCGRFCSVGVRNLVIFTNDRYPYKALAPAKVFPNVNFDTFILLDDQEKVHQEFQRICAGGTIKARVTKELQRQRRSEQIVIDPSFSISNVNGFLLKHSDLNDDDDFFS